MLLVVDSIKQVNKSQVNIKLNGAVTYHRIRATDAEWTEKIQKLLIRCSSGGESRLGGDEGLRGTCKEHIKRMSNAYVTDK